MVLAVLRPAASVAALVGMYGAASAGSKQMIPAVAEWIVASLARLGPLPIGALAVRNRAEWVEAAM